MANTIVGVYDHYSQAESALNDLLALGFPRSALMMGPAEDTLIGRQAALRMLEKADDRSNSSLVIPEFFRTLFGGDRENEYVDIYAEAVRRGSYLLIVNVDNAVQRDQALEAMDRYGPVDIDARAAEWKSQGWSGYDDSAPAMSDAEIDRERSAHPARGGVRVFQRDSD